MIKGINIVLLFVDLDQYLYTSSNYLSTLFIQALLQGLINPTETKYIGPFACKSETAQEIPRSIILSINQGFINKSNITSTSHNFISQFNQNIYVRKFEEHLNSFPSNFCSVSIHICTVTVMVDICQHIQLHSYKYFIHFLQHQR
jgi:hypothetical protein